MSRIDKRLAALEKSTAPARPNTRFTADLLLIYGTLAEQAAARPAVTRAEWEAAIDQVYGNPMQS